MPILSLRELSERYSSIRKFNGSGGIDELLPAAANRVAFWVGFNGGNNFVGEGTVALANGGIQVNGNPAWIEFFIERHGTVVKHPWWVNTAVGQFITLIEVLQD